MADTLDIELRAKTDAAVTEVRKFNTEIRDATTAATVAGSAQQQLGKDVALTAARVRDSKEAIAGAKQALETHNATVAAFGASSTQAAASAAKLSAAENEARKAAAEAADALAELAKEAAAVAAAEDGQLTPATKRAAAQVARMGETVEQAAYDLNRMELQAAATARATEEKLMRATERAGAELTRMHGTTSKVGRQLQDTAYHTKKGADGFDVMGMASGKLMSVLGPAALGGTLIAVTKWLGESATATLQYETAIANLPFTIEGARKSTRGLVSDQALVTAAANASALGVAKTSEQFAGLAAATAKLAKPGQDVNALLNEITGALGRGSSESLNNVNVILTVGEAQRRYAESLGVTVASLTDEQKATAFKVEGLKAVIAAAEATTIAYDSNAAALVRLKTTAIDAWDRFERAAVQGAGAAVGAMGELSKAMFHDEEWIPILVATANTMDTTWSPAFTRGAESVAKFTADLLLAGDAYEVVAQFANPGNLAAMDAANEKERAKRDLLSEEAAFSERMAKAAAEVEKANTAFLDAQAAAAVVYGPAEAPKKKKNAAKKKKHEMLDPGDVAIARGFDGVEQTELVARAAPEAAAEGRAEREAQLFEEATLRNRRASEMLVDRVGLEEETEARRAALVDQQLAREAKLAQWQAQNARTTTQREQALTRMEEVEHRKRVLAAQREAAEERKLAEQRAATFERIGGAASNLSATIVAAAWEQAAGQKGAIAMMLGDRLKGISIDATVTAAWETAQGVAAAAGVYTAALAPGHFLAAAESAAVAVLAGAAGAGLGAAGKAASGGGAGGASSRAPSTAPAAPAPTPGGQGGSTGERLERQEVPISYAPASPAPSIVINIGTFTGTKDAARGLAAEVSKALTRHKAQGARP